MEDNRLYAWFWFLLLIFFIVSIGSLATYLHQRNLVVADMVASGAHPLDAKCAVSSDIVCNIRMAK